MPFYQNLFTCKPRAPPSALTELYRRLCNDILESGGMVRCIENHGILPLAYRFRAKQVRFVTDIRYHTKGRWISLYFDANPEAASRLETCLKAEEYYLRSTTLKPVVKMNWLITKHRTNPWEWDPSTPLPSYMIPSNRPAYAPGTAPDFNEYAKLLSTGSGLSAASHVPVSTRYKRDLVAQKIREMRTVSPYVLGRPVAPTDMKLDSESLIHRSKFIRKPGTPYDEKSYEWLSEILEDDEVDTPTDGNE